MEKDRQENSFPWSLTGIIYAFDFFGEPVASLNMAGCTRFRTKFGGSCGLSISMLIFWFTVTRYIMMIGRDGAKVSQVNLGLDLMDPSSPDYNFQDLNYTLGFGLFTNTWVVDQERGQARIISEPFDFSEFLEVYSTSY